MRRFPKPASATTLTQPAQAQAAPLRAASTEVVITPVNTLVEYLTFMQNEMKGIDTLWFRGTGNASHKLVPSIYRHAAAATHAERKELESKLNETFRNKSIPFVNIRFSTDNDWDQLFFMQHYRVPTRLLDWSSSPLVALYFALTSANANAKRKYESDAAVWVLDPREWNRAALKHLGYKAEVISTSDPVAKRYRPAEVYEAQTNPPIAIQGAYNSPRIVAQKGSFTVFGPVPTPMEDEFAANLTYDRKCLKKLLINRDAIDSLRTEIFRAGVSEASIYPDLEGLAIELRREFKF